MKRLAILGSTGSIGRQSLDVCRRNRDRLEIIALACGANVPLLKQQVSEFRPRFIYHEGGEVIPDATFMDLREIAAIPDVDFVVMATSGKAGLEPTLAALRAGKTVGLANKEVLVMAGEVLSEEVEKQGSRILPIDSEHSAIWQCLESEDRDSVSGLVLTASGGPFRLKSPGQLSVVTAREALAHPTWSMGPKVTIDSATLMNKGMEIIEAHWLFGMPYSRIEVMVHPESIVHSIVRFVDGSSKAQMSVPDMRMPIQYALSYPERWVSEFVPELDLTKIGALTFEEVDLSKFPCLKLAIEAGEKGGTYPAVLSAADEVAVELFLNGKIGIPDIAYLVGETLNVHRNVCQPTIHDILEADAWAREVTKAVFLG